MPTPPAGTLIYDGHCGFCRIWLEYWQALCGDSLEYVPSQEIGDRFPALDRTALKSAVYLVASDGSVCRGAHAVFKSLAPVSIRYRVLLWLYTHIALFRVVTDAAYTWIASHRDFAYWATVFVFGKPIRPKTWHITGFLFLRLLGLTYFFAFTSLRPQIVGLVGAHGLSPVAPVLAAIHANYGLRAYWLVPSIAWINASDEALVLYASLGMFFAVLLTLNLVPRLAALACLVLYLSLCAVGQPFTLFQWDALLVEAGFLALFAGLPWLNWMYRLLGFRLLFESGLVKWLSGDPNWRNLHALRFHFWTQPLPTPAAWYVAHAPVWLLDSFTALVFLVELAVPFLLFMPRRFRHWGAGLLIGFQVFIAVTGNYAFFNLLTIAILLWAFEDQFFVERVRILGRIGKLPRTAALAGTGALASSGKPAPRDRLDFARRFGSWFTATPAPRIPGVSGVAAVICVLIAITGLGQVVSMLASQRFGWLDAVERDISSLELVNSYGLFAVMTTDRPEIIFEGSEDGVEWREYEFPDKPGDLSRPLPLVAPFQPRLDWQLWFAAMGPMSQSPWAGNLAIRLLEGEPSVLRLLNPPPFAHPPKYLRALLYQYEFTSLEQRATTGHVWTRQRAGVFIPQFSLADLR
jgi:predicted DCC family thiol-disulfide oxidoreductase YuxK